ncbi:MAG TPA: SMP-30/gluconolactonase/LRE family protein [Acidimicrobiales bacterium]|nr:SMP-30/gluconolactonase/LRE family protein [Acidimicrobiales bacterium]
MAVLEDLEVVAEGLAYPEGPVAMDDGSVLLVEIRRGTLSRVDPDGSVEVVAECGDGPDGAAIGPDGACYLANGGGLWPNRTGPGRIQRADLVTGRVEDLYASCAGRPLHAPNDLVFDAAGGMWFTDTGHGDGRTMDFGSVFYALPDGSSITEVITPTTQANGIGLSPDGAVLYYSETQLARVHRRTVVAPGRLAPIEPISSGTIVLGRVPTFDSLLVGLPGYAELDSLAVDSAGNVCVATLLDPGITVISPDGASVEHLALPADLGEALVTNICFGGPDLRTAYLTLSTTGRLVACRWPRPGLQLAFRA